MGRQIEWVRFRERFLRGGEKFHAAAYGRSDCGIDFHLTDPYMERGMAWKFGTPCIRCFPGSWAARR